MQANGFDFKSSARKAHMTKFQHLDNIPHAFFIIRNNRFQFVNSRLLHLTGHETPEELIGRPYTDIIKPPDVGLIPDMESNDEMDQHFEMRLIRKDGSTCWVECHTKSLPDEKDGSIWGILTDISALKECELNLKSADEKFIEVMESLADGYAEISMQGKILYANEAMYQIYGYTREELAKANWYDYLSITDNPDVYDGYRHVYNTGKAQKSLVFVAKQKDGAKRTIEASISLVQDKAGNKIGYRGIRRDITEQIEAQKLLSEQRSRLEATFQSVQDAIITVDAEMRVTDANMAIEKVCGYTPKKMIGQLFANCLESCGRECQSILLQTLENGKTIQEQQIECVGKNRVNQIKTVSSAPLLMSGNKEPGGAVIVIRDITRLRSLEWELKERHQYQQIIGKSKRMQELFGLMERLAEVETTALISGESGTGKELVAKALHFAGKRADKPFVSVNCSALAENLLESELFGHVKGAFTGAIKDSQGRFQTADGGTIVLDEIGDISPRIQLKLLRVIQEREIERVGESVPIKVDVRVIASTNTDLKEKVRLGEFREDLYYRLKVVEVFVPPLRDRIEDIPLLVEHFVERFNKTFGKKIDAVDEHVLGAYLNYHWPGNVRELEHSIERAFVLCRGRFIRSEHMSLEIMENQKAQVPGPGKLKKPDEERRELVAALEKTGWVRERAAKLLGLSRHTIYRKIMKFKIEKPEIYK